MTTDAERGKEDRTDRELAFQRAEAERLARVSATHPGIITRYRETRHFRLYPKEYIYRDLLRSPRHLGKVLDFGCGTGEISTQLALLGAERVLGVDLSAELISVAKRRAELDSVADRVEFRVADGERIELPHAHFDAVLVVALLHHTEIEPVLERVLDAVRTGGRVYIVEPVSYSRALSAVRDMLPIEKHVSPDERQLNAADVAVIRSHFRTSYAVHFNGLGRLQRFLTRDASAPAGWLAQRISYLVHWIDRLVFSMPGGWRCAGTVLVVGEK